MKLFKFPAALAAAVLCMASLCGALAQESGLHIVTTIFPVYDWVRQISAGAQGVEVTLLEGSGVDLHSYQPTAEDLLEVTTCDVFVYVGGESDHWVEDALAEAVSPRPVAVNLLECLGDRVRTEELVEGMEHDHDEGHGEDHDGDHDEGHDEDHDHGHEEEADEHIWLSLRNAQVLVRALAEKMSGAAGALRDTFTGNAAAYCKALEALDAQYSDTLARCAHHTLLFGDRFPFRYLVEDYGLSYYAAFSGCSAESEASFATIAFLAGKVDELHLPAVLTLEGARHRIAQTVIQAASEKNLKVLTLNSMQGITAADVRSGAAYLDIMASNLEVLTEALN